MARPNLVGVDGRAPPRRPADCAGFGRIICAVGPARFAQAALDQARMLAGPEDTLTSVAVADVREAARDAGLLVIGADDWLHPDGVPLGRLPSRHDPGSPVAVLTARGRPELGFPGVVLVGTQGSEDQHAVVVAATIAARHDTRVVLAHVGRPDSALQLTLAEQAADVLAITGRNPPVVTVAGLPIDRLTAMASSIGAGLLVLGSRVPADARRRVRVCGVPRLLLGTRTACGELRTVPECSLEHRRTRPGCTAPSERVGWWSGVGADSGPPTGIKGAQVKPFMKYGGIVASVILIAFGLGSLYTGVNGRSEVRDTLKLEQIVGTPDMDAAIANKPVDTGADAKLFAAGIRKHTLEATGGQVYSEMGRFLDASGKPTSDEKAAAVDAKSGQPVPNPARDTWITSTALSTALNTAFFAESVATFAIVMGVAMLLIGIGFLVMLFRLPWAAVEAAEQPRRTPATKIAIPA